MRKFNIIKSELRNEKIIKITRDLGANAPALDLRHLLLPVRDQGSTDKCAGYVGACIKEYQERAVSNFPMSADYIYCHRKEGLSQMSVQNLLDILKEFGCVREQEMPDNIDVKSEQMKKLEAIGKNFTINSYARCESVQATIQALNTYGVCMIAVPIYKKSAEKSTQIWKPENSTDEKVGGHAMIICGYLIADEKIQKLTDIEIGEYIFIIRNSWGESWGDKGYTYMNFKDFHHIWDVYVTTDNITDVTKIPQLINVNKIGKNNKNKSCCLII
jgi:C1A family cysteine protease